MRVSIIAITSFLALGNSGVQALAIPSNQALASDAQSQVDQAVAPLVMRDEGKRPMRVSRPPTVPGYNTPAQSFKPAQSVKQSRQVAPGTAKTPKINPQAPPNTQPGPAKTPQINPQTQPNVQPGPAKTPQISPQTQPGPVKTPQTNPQAQLNAQKGPAKTPKINPQTQPNGQAGSQSLQSNANQRRQVRQGTQRVQSPGDPQARPATTPEPLRTTTNLRPGNPVVPNTLTPNSQGPRKSGN